MAQDIWLRHYLWDISTMALDNWHNLFASLYFNRIVDLHNEIVPTQRKNTQTRNKKYFKLYNQNTIVFPSCTFFLLCFLNSKILSPTFQIKVKTHYTLKANLGKKVFFVGGGGGCTFCIILEPIFFHFIQCFDKHIKSILNTMFTTQVLLPFKRK